MINNHSQVNDPLIVVVWCRFAEQRVSRTVQDVVELCAFWIRDKGNAEVQTVPESFLSVRKLQRQQRE